MIRDVQDKTDAAGFPIVSWRETRGLHAPGARGTARVECRIMKTADTGLLMFVARSLKGEGRFEEARPWQLLTGFSLASAENLYYTKADLETRRQRAGQNLASKLLWSDNGQVLLAEFDNELPLHINCAEATAVEMDRLHVLLKQRFELTRDSLPKVLCKKRLHFWALDDHKVVTFEPERRGWPNAPDLSPVTPVLQWSIFLAVLLAIVAVVAFAILRAFAMA